MDSVAPPRARELIHSLAELGFPDGELLDLLVEEVEWLTVPAGRRLFTEGDPADGMYLLFEGRVRFVIETSAGLHVASELDAVGVFGEGALLTGEGRSRTAVVIRDAVLARLPPARFEQISAAVPGVALAVAKRVAHRTVFPTMTARHLQPRPTRVTICAPLLAADRLRPIVDSVSRALDAAVVWGSDFYRSKSIGDSIIARSANIVTVLSRDDDEFIPAALRQSDRALVVVEARSSVNLTSIEALALSGMDPLAAPLIELVLLHSGRDTYPIDTARWLTRHEYPHHHIRDGRSEDLERIGRHLAGTAVGLVLSGGGARGLAHIGVIRALHELGIPIDRVGGSSMGAIVGGQCAFGWSWEEMLAYNERSWNNARMRLDVTVPTVSLFSGRRSRRIFDEAFGTNDISDAWIPFFCTSVDLTQFRLVIHRQGPAADWIRASASAPGLWPPVIDAEGHLHIDGGQLNNVPTDVMREHHGGPIIAVDVFARQATMALTPGSDPPVGLKHLWRRKSKDRYPGFTDILNRCALLGSLQHQEGARRYADVYLTPDLSALSFGAFDKIREACAVGYQCAMASLADFPTP